MTGERPDIMPPVMPINRFAEFSGFGRTTIYKLMKTGELASEFVNGRRVIALHSYYEMIEAARAAERQPERPPKARSEVQIRPPKQGVIYFVVTPSGHVKIGYSSNPDSRLKALQTASSVPLRILATIRGTLKEEEALHARFAEYRMHGEWFTLAGKLLDFIETFADG